ncbi:MAG: hypothetical protein BGO01_12430 [Armatimonadetes bacterium 55-13]|nr:hypothetical protein [Armatimonadota bacterium]OJU61720.1 MAG: hypothetical protein BGO01_12430 [Armatimonadetes bacterium 55-13]
MVSLLVSIFCLVQDPPPWATFSQDQSDKVLREIRRGIVEGDGGILGAKQVDQRKIDQAIGTFVSNRSASNAYRLVYRIIQFQPSMGVPASVKDPWATMGKNTYEVARLRFLFTYRSLEYNQIPLGEDLLKIDPKDTEVMWALSVLYSHQGPRNVWKPERGVELAEAACKLYPSLRTFARVGDAYVTLFGKTNKDSDAQSSARFYKQYLAAANENSFGYKNVVRDIKWLKERGYCL